MSEANRMSTEEAKEVKTNFINGKWLAAYGRDTIDVVSPSTGDKIGEISRGALQDINAAVNSARQAYDGVWGVTPAFERGRLLSKLGLRIAECAEELSQIEARDTGKSMKLARNDIAATARYVEYYGGTADKIHGDTIPFLEGYQVLIVREPAGTRDISFRGVILHRYSAARLRQLWRRVLLAYASDRPLTRTARRVQIVF